MSARRPLPEDAAVDAGATGAFRAFVSSAMDRADGIDALLRGVRCVAWRAELPSLAVDYVSDSAAEVLGWAPDRWREPGFHHSILHPEDLPAVLRHAAGVSAAPGPAKIEYRVRHADGRWLHVEDTIAIGRDAAGAPAVLQGLMVDVSESRHELQRLRLDGERLRESDEWRERFAVAARASGVTLFDYDVAADRHVWHSADGTVFGHPPESLRSFANWVALVLPEDRDRYVARHAVNLDAPAGQQVMEYRVRHADGRVRAVESRSELVWRDGAPWRHVGHLADVTARHELERRLRMQSIALEALGESVTVVRTDETIVLVNGATERMFGWSRRELIGQSLQLLTARRGADFRRRGAELAAHVLEHGHWTGEVGARRRDGSGFRVLATITSAVIGGDRYWITVRKDVTERRELEREVLRSSEREQERLAQELHEGLGQQISGLAFLAASLQDEAERAGSPLAAQAGRLARLAGEAVAGCRRLAQGVSGFSLQHGGLAASLREVALDCGRRHGVECVLRIDAEVAGALADEQAYQLYRIAQEAATAALRHGGATALAIALERDGAGGRLVVADGGGEPEDVDRVAQARRVIGYRAALIGAELQVRAVADGGTRVECGFPLNAPAETGAGATR